ncbi:class I SAM-dependent methyltransferase [Gymnodinialimonas ceratoperidinii]|uniref:Class I SAM-dependent methyltransferase n=1 Tax=Gymnodinialimonas ceratoperidinii TaxID=2856823 RepID=A0A8F6U0P2_9RHOB|nr:class I SAM-dependent methyltransferase [Gymnodinialimonas ceratoperidinii]QXT41474.1 class I SAM-dependent methyltransferase [Gymnodinialimonas ceratoperidinii]
MHLDVIDLRQFYYRTRLGRIAQKAVRERMLGMWPSAKGETVVGYGFAVPLLRPYLAEAQRVIGVMPAQQGVMPWPAGQDNVSVLCREGLWPVQTGQADKLVCLHGLETSEHPASVLEECQRVLAPEGRAIFVVPNRMGLWARRDGTPFGFGRPYSLGQLEAQLEAFDFIPQRHAAALFALPSPKRFWLRSADMLESLGTTLSRNRAGGVILIEVTKRIPARRKPGLAERVRRPLSVLEGSSQPVGVSGRGYGKTIG